MYKRLFISVKLPEQIKEEIIFIKNEIKEEIDKGVKWVEDDNLHITLVFLGQMKERDFLLLTEKLKEIKISSPVVLLKKVSYFPDKKNPKLVWIEGESPGLADLNRKIGRQNNDFKLHITLGRIKKWEFKNMELGVVPEIQKDLNLSFTVFSFQLMESNLSKNGPKYSLIESFKFN